jgi:hypothetical protein
LLLFENPDNLEVKTEFDQVMAEVINPFSNVRLWLMYEVLEIEAMQETFDKRRKVLGKYRAAVL